MSSDREGFFLKKEKKACVCLCLWTGFFVELHSIVGRPYVNQSRLEGLWLGGGSNTAQYCFLSPHVQPGNEAVSRSLSVCFRNLLRPKSNEQI